jgi:hypothetical protein
LKLFIIQLSKYIKIKNNNNIVRWKSTKTNEIYYRYYNIYSNNELMEEIIRLKPEFKINKYAYKKMNNINIF